MKFRNPETGKVFDWIDEALDQYCNGKGCNNQSCKLAKYDGFQQTCVMWAEDHPHEAARLMGYEVVEDDASASKANASSMQECDQQAKADAGKLELDLVPTQIFRDIAEVRMYGNRKYHDPGNWKTVELRRYINALLRHTLEFVDDLHSVDSESGILHYKHMACNMAFICEMMEQERKKENSNES